MNFEYYSSVAIVTSVVVLMLAMFAHAAEWAAARALPSELVTTKSRRRVLAGAAVGGTVGAAKDSDSRLDAGEPGEAASVPLSDAQQMESRLRIELFGRAGVGLTVIGFVLTLAGVIMRGLAAGRAPWGNMYEFTTAAVVFILAAYLIMVWKADLRWLGLPVALLAVIANGAATTVFYVAVAPLVPALHSIWFLIHIVAAAIAGAAFNIGGLLSIVYLVRSRAERKGRIPGYLTRLPDARRIDVLTYRFHAFAFPLWTFTVAAGAIWAEYAWGRYWGWDPKETWALVTWVIYACYLHARSTAGWKGSRAAAIAIVGLVSFWFNFVGINLLVSGLHSYAGV